jgi:hypothetical protein
MDSENHLLTLGAIFLFPRPPAKQGSLNSGVMSFEELRKVFSVMDLNHVGSITHVELQELMRRFGTPITDEEAHAMVIIHK